jgi:geranylgeranyl pyrophosphate synthase
MSSILELYNVDPKSGALIAKTPSKRKLELQVEKLIKVVKDLESRIQQIEIRLLLNTSVSKKEKLFLAKVFGNDNLKEEDKKELFDLLTKYNIKDNHSKILNLYNQKAKKNIKKLPKLYQEIFIFIEEFNTKRIK